jgi:hypothetical protein
LIFLVFIVAFWWHLEERYVMVLLLGVGFGCVPYAALLWLLRRVLGMHAAIQRTTESRHQA